MPPIRSTSDRRRRVLYSSHQADGNASIPTTRREVEKLREARRPTALYGERVQRRLEARWFALVPVSQQSHLIVASVVFSIVSVLTGMHYLSVTWPTLALMEDVARPFRMDRRDSFGGFFQILFLATTSGVCLLTYQLRRYRLDDYVGRYRIWRTVVIATAIASLGSSVSLIDWTGSLIDAAFGKRVALSGVDWIRLFVALGGTTLLLRLLAEVRHCKPAIVGLLSASCILMIPEAAGWNLFEVNSAFRWWAVTSAPLLGSALLCLAFTSNLRMLYREVCEIQPGPSIRERVNQLKLRLRHDEPDEHKTSPRKPKTAIQAKPVSNVKAVAAKRKTEPAKQESKEDANAKPSRKRWWTRKERNNHSQSPTKEVVANIEEEPTDDSELETAKPKNKARRWWNRTPKDPAENTAVTDKAHSVSEETASRPDDQTNEVGKKKRRFALAWKSKEAAKEETTDDSSDISATDTSETEPAPRRRRFGLAALMKKKTPAESDDATGEEETVSNSQQETKATQAVHPPQPGDDSLDIDPDSIDWNSMSKAERRRVRKQLKRQGRAA